MSIQSIVNQIIKEAVSDNNDERRDKEKIHDYWMSISVEIKKLLGGRVSELRKRIY